MVDPDSVSPLSTSENEYVSVMSSLDVALEGES